jgi:hypothetical protein
MLFDLNYTTASLLHKICSWLYLTWNSKFPVTDISTFTTLKSQHFSVTNIAVPSLCSGFSNGDF